MQWTREIDAYCERLGPEFWAEPINAATNAGFLLIAITMARRVRGQNDGVIRVLIFILGAIGIGSFLFHTYAQVWAALADTLPILLFILTYIFAINRAVWTLRPGPSLMLTALFFPYMALTVPVFRLLPGLGSSAGYAPIPVLIAIYALALRKRAPDTARGLAIGAVLLAVSILMRALDMPLCGTWGSGTHFLWHLFNAVMLGWMIEVYRRHLTRAVI